ncbi:MAG: tRNA pseudouridine(55) synthase TruB [Clostridiales bacterium]|nr:tRNA pseudouridine(55) synthase TruB [Clostridiales bacterium]
MTGIICLDKPDGMTSFSAVAAVRRITGEKKCGHSGTLDPMATGVLPVFLGGATRFIELLPVHDKSYTASLRLGITTDTLDITGKVLSQRKASVSHGQIEELIPEFTGKILQVPPMYSAISKNGVRLYELARKGIEIEREAREITINSIIITDFDEAAEEYTLEVSCSQGTYIRSLISDIGERLGCGAVMTALRRTKSNGFSSSQALTPEQLSLALSRGELSCIQSVDAVLGAYPEVHVTQPQAVRFSNGGELDINRLSLSGDCPTYRVYSPSGDFLGIGQADAAVLRVKRVYNNI